MATPLTPEAQAAILAYQALDPDGRRAFTSAILKPDRNDPTGEPGPSDPWQAFTLADAYQERPPVEYVAAGLFALPSVNIVYGAPGTLKSLLMADLSICAAAGLDWLPPAPWINGNLARAISTLQSPTMWIDFDNGQGLTHERIGALARARNLPAETPITYYSLPSPWLDATNKNSIGALSLRILDRGARFVVIDNLTLISGNADENSTEMGAVMSLLRQLSETTGAAINVIHHQRKGNGAGGRAGDALRGHSSIEAALDLALSIEREELADTVNIKATKTRRADVLPFSAVWTYESKPSNPQELLTGKFYGIANEDKRSNLAIESAIRAALYGITSNKTELTNNVKGVLVDVGVNRIRDLIARMESTGKLRVTAGKNNTEKIYSLP